MSDEHSYVYTMEAPVDSVPASVVSLVPSITESLFDLGLGSRLVGRTDYCIYPEGLVDGIPTVGGTKNPAIERIIALRPSLVIANYEENRKADVEALQAADIPVWVTFPRTVPDVFTLLWNLMYLFDQTDMAPRVRLIEKHYDMVLNMSEANEENLPRVFVPIWHDPLMTFNKDTYAHDLLRVLGGANVFAKRERQFPLAADMGNAQPLAADDERLSERDTRYPRVSDDEVEAAQPDIILLPSEPFAFTEAHRPLFQKLDVPAVANQRIHLVDGSLLTWHGTRLAHALAHLPALFRLDE